MIYIYMYTCIQVFLYAHILYHMLILAFRIMFMFSQFSFWFSSFSSLIIQLFVVRWSYISFCVMQPEVMIKRRWHTTNGLWHVCCFFCGGGGCFWGGGGGCGCDSLELNQVVLEFNNWGFFWCICLVISTMISQRNQRYERWRREANAKFFEVPVYRPFFNAMRHWFEFLRLTGTLIPSDVRLT